MEKYCTAKQATDGNIIWSMRIACWITTPTNIHSEYVILIAFPLQQWLHKAPQRYDIRKLAAWFYLAKNA